MYNDIVLLLPEVADNLLNVFEAHSVCLCAKENRYGLYFQKQKFLRNKSRKLKC